MRPSSCKVGQAPRPAADPLVRPVAAFRSRPTRASAAGQGARPTCITLTVAALLALALPLAAQDSLDAAADQLATVRRPYDVVISPNGALAAWTEEVHGKDGQPTAATAVYILDLRTPNAEPRRISAKRGEGDSRDGSPVWSPDSSRLLFVSDAGKHGQAQLYVAPATGGTARRLTSFNGVIASPAWSSDGQRIALLVTEGASGLLGPLEATAAQTGVIDNAFHNRRLMVMPSAGGAARAISPENLHVYEYDWSPDGSRFVVSAAPGPGDNNWWTARLYTLAEATGKTEPLYQPGAATQIAGPRWAPDGSSVAFVGGLMSDQAVTGGDVFVVTPGSPARNLTEGRPASASSVRWTAPGRLLVTEWFGGGSRIVALDSTGHAEVLWTGEEDAHSDGYAQNFSADREARTSVLIRSTWMTPPEIWAGPVGQWKQVTKLNAAHRAPWSDARNLEWTSDNLHVQGWLIYPHDYSLERRYPMVVDVHGGPSSSVRSSWPRPFYNAAVLAAAGYFVFFPNPRGSYGQGEAFTRANVNDFGGGDLRDILAGVDAVLKSVPVDPKRIGITGWSYGGFMTMFAVTQTDRFHAAVAGAGIANWQSYYGQNSIDQWLIPFFGASVYDNPAAYARASAINFIKQVHTPALVVVGERDGECPAPQSFEFWHALKTLGVPTELVVYPGEGHSFRKPENRRDVMQRVFRWFQTNLG